MLASDKISCSPESGQRSKGIFTSINLYNFESAEANNCPYILTSPRSLKACSSANIKPIELLHRSLSEIAKDLNLPIQSVGHIYEDYERERIRKLETCKLVRKHMMQNCETEQVQKFASSSSPNIFPNRETVSRLSNCFRDETPEFLYSRERKSRSPYSTPATPISHYSSFKKGKNSSLRCNLSSSNSSISSVTFNVDEKYTRSKSVDCEKYRKFSSKKLTKKTTANAKKKSNNCNFQLKNDIRRKYQMSEAERMNDQQLCWQIDNVKKSSALFDGQKNNHKNAQKSGNLIETKRSKNKQNVIEQNKFIKNCEKAINGKQDCRMKSPKKKKVTHILSKSTSKVGVEVEHNSKKSNDKYNESVKNNDLEGSKSENERQIEDYDGLNGLKNHDLRILDAMALKRELQKTQDNFAQRARVVWASSPDEGLSNMTHKNLVETNTDSKHQKVDCCHFPENITFETYFNHIRNKIKQLKEDSLHKELHGEHVRQLARELQLGMEQWQDQVLLLQWQALQRARTNAKLHIENKRLKTQCENNERVLLHALRLKNIQNMERLKQISMKKEIEEKDGKIEKLKMKREREILDCRAQAHYTAELREQLRRTLTPETFDQKVNNVIVKTRFINRSLTASPFVESHIRLG